MARRRGKAKGRRSLGRRRGCAELSGVAIGNANRNCARRQPLVLLCVIVAVALSPLSQRLPLFVSPAPTPRVFLSSVATATTYSTKGQQQQKRGTTQTVILITREGRGKTASSPLSYLAPTVLSWGLVPQVAVRFVSPAWSAGGCAAGSIRMWRDNLFLFLFLPSFLGGVMVFSHARARLPFLDRCIPAASACHICVKLANWTSQEKPVAISFSRAYLF